MKKIDSHKMENINGGVKCIYHGIAAVGSTLLLGLVGAVTYYLIDGSNLSQCLDNKHNEH